MSKAPDLRVWPTGSATSLNRLNSLGRPSRFLCCALAHRLSGSFIINLARKLTFTKSKQQLLLLVAKLLKQVESWQSEAGHKRLPSQQSTLTGSEGLDAHDSNGDRPPRDVMLEVRASLAKSQQLHADRMARIRQDYNDGIARIEAERKRRAKPAHAAAAPAGLHESNVESTVSCGEPFKSATGAPIMQPRASADVRGPAARTIAQPKPTDASRLRAPKPLPHQVLTIPRERQPSSMPSPLGTRPAFQHKVSMQRHGLPMQGVVEELRASVEQPVYTRGLVLEAAQKRPFPDMCPIARNGSSPTMSSPGEGTR